MKKTVIDREISDFIYCKELPQGVVIGMDNGIILIGTKKERTAATGVLSGF